MEKAVGHPVPFANVSNTCYGSHGDAACLILVYQDQYLDFMRYLHDHKEKPGFTNIEKNFYTAVKDCIPTLTELAIHALYNIFISQPFMQHV